MSKRILFVDDEPDILASMRRMLRPVRSEWEMEFCESGQDALERFEQQVYDVVVSDIRMPGMDGVELLNRIKQHHPQTIRIALSGHSEPDALLRAVGPTHQFLSKPCDAEVLMSVVNRASVLRELLSEPSLLQFVTEIDSLPSLPAIYLEVMEELKSPTGSLKKVGDIIERDTAMSAKILQLVNSAFFGVTRHISGPAQAASLLGVETIRALVLSMKIFTEFDNTITDQIDFDSLWKHSYHTGRIAKSLAEHAGLDSRLVDDAFIAGLLHNVGILVLASGFPDEYAAIMSKAGDDLLQQLELEKLRLGHSHAEIGGYLLGLWGFPDSILEAIFFHHNPAAAPVHDTFSPLTAVHLVSSYVSSELSSNGISREKLLDMEYLEKTGVNGELTDWLELAEKCMVREQDSE